MGHAPAATGPPDGPGSPCPSLDALESLVRGEAGDDEGSLAAHVQACSACGDRLEEMRSAHAFLARFESASLGDVFAHDGTGNPEARPSVAIAVPGYEVESMVAIGGQGAVYKARQKTTGRAVAIKVPLGDAIRRPATRFRFQREIELTARLDHPGIVRVIGACELTDGRLGCVMEFVTGDPIDEWASEQRPGGRDGVRRIVEVMAQVADAIAYAHQRAVMHRDIKPSNIVVNQDCSPRVLDFGLAKALDDSAASFLTLTGAFVGTLVYAAPEQLSAGQEVIDLRTDVYGLGLLLYQALTGRLPHATDAPTMELLRHIREVPALRPSMLNPLVGTELDAIILKAIAKQKERRYASAAELRDDLRAWLDGRAVRARLDSKWYVIQKAVRRHRWAAVIAATGAVALATIGVLSLSARAQTTRARLADAVRNARVLESHWVGMAEARSIGLDNFEAGETIAWDALLEPEQVLLDESVEGFGPDGPPPASPAYWALWEMYQRTPLLLTVPLANDVILSYGRADLLVLAHRNSRQLQWINWRGWEVLRSIDAPLAATISGMVVAPDTGAVVLVDGVGPAILVDPRSTATFSLGDGNRALAAVISDERAATTVLTAETMHELLLWDISELPPLIVRRVPIPERTANMVFDRSGRYLAATCMSGELLILDTGSGEVLLHRRSGELPRFPRVFSRGNPSEFILNGPEKIAVVDMAGSAARDIERAFRKGGILDGVKILASAADADRYVYISDRWRLGLGSKSRPITEGRYLPALSVDEASLSADGRYAAIGLRPSNRGAILDLDSPAVRRLPFDAPVTASGFATIFTVNFTADSRTLIAGAMDGSIRRFDTVSGAPLPTSTGPIAGGITSLQMVGDDIFAGTHDLGLNDARVVRVRGNEIETLVAGNERWFCDLASSPGRTLWALTGEGHILMLDPESRTLIREARLERHPESQTFRALARVPHHRLLLAGPAGTGIEMLDEDTLESRGPSVAMPPLRHIAVHPTNPDLIATGGDDGKIRLWRFRAGPPPILDPVRSFGVHAGPIFNLAFSPDGRLLASGGGAPETRDVRLWDVERGRELAAFDLFELGVFTLAFSPDGRWLAAGGEVRLAYSEEGGQLFLIDLHAADACIAGNLEHHLSRFRKEHGREASQAAPLREWAAGVQAAARGS